MEQIILLYNNIKLFVIDIYNKLVKHNICSKKDNINKQNLNNIHVVNVKIKKIKIKKKIEN